MKIQKKKRYKCKLNNCLLCSYVVHTKYLCIFCNDLYYPIEHDIINVLPYNNCYNELEGYYLDINIYKKCYYSCKSCKIGGNNNNHNCLECKNFFNYKLN